METVTDVVKDMVGSMGHVVRIERNQQVRNKFAELGLDHLTVMREWNYGFGEPQITMTMPESQFKKFLEIMTK